ncbi:MAG TPA: porin family protein [Rubricoccaceae bacterium]|jgi:hypothetical protein
MSPRTLLLAATAFVALPALAPAADAQTAFGLRAGLNVSDFSGDDAPDNTDPRLGFAGGLFARVPVGASGLYVQPEVSYSMKGVTGEDGNGGDATIAVDYVEVPLLLGIATPVTDSGLMVGGYAGPALGIKVRESVDFSVGGSSGSIESDVFNDLDVGAAFGVTVGAGPFGVDGRYTLGLVNAIDANEDADVRNGVFTIAGTYTFGR